VTASHVGGVTWAEDFGLLVAGNDAWRKEGEGGENSVMRGPFGASGIIEKSL
jgi:hypothetical protein